MDNKTIICFEPWGGTAISDKDTGLGNRLLHWASLYYISTICGNCKILVEKKYWPELQFLELPNTESCEKNLNNIKSTSLKLSSQDIKDIIYEKNLNILDDNFDCYYSDEFICFENEITSLGISKIKFKNDNITKFFKDNFSNIFTVHLRRGLGTIPTFGFIKDFLSYKTKEDFKKYCLDYYLSIRYDPPEEYSIIPDRIYFSVIDEIIKENSNQKFYISSDIKEEYYSYYFDRYSNNIIKKEEYFHKFISLLNIQNDFYLSDELNTFVGSKKFSLHSTLANLFDLFVLINSHTLVVDNYSTWSIVASLIGRKKKLIKVIDYILRKDSISYETFVKKYSYYRLKCIREKNELID